MPAGPDGFAGAPAAERVVELAEPVGRGERLALGELPAEPGVVRVDLEPDDSAGEPVVAVQQAADYLQDAGWATARVQPGAEHLPGD